MADITPGLQQQLQEYVDYLISGPAGLGQNFSGLSFYQPAYLTGTFRAPFTVPLSTTPPPLLTVDPIAITDITVLSVTPGGTSRYIRVDFTAQSEPPFVVGGNCSIAGADDAFYNGDYNRAVVECTTSSVLLQTQEFYTWPPYVSGGDIFLTNTNFGLSADTIGTVTVTGPTDIVFVSAQLALDVDYTVDAATEWDVTVKVNRYRGFVSENPLDPEIVFDFDATISEQTTHFDESVSGSASCGQNIFTTVLDSPSFGLYRYFVEVYFYNYNTAAGAVQDSTRYSTGGFVKTGSTPVITTEATYTGLVPVTDTGTGSGAVLDITLYASGATLYSDDMLSIVIDTGGSDYQVGDFIRVLGTDLGAATPANDLILQIATIDGQYYPNQPGASYPTTMRVGLRSLTAQVVKQ
jgi:hypothetical protein